MKYLKDLEKWFFSFWIVRSKITYLLAIIIAIFGIIALGNIPKESDPQINFPIVNITTSYQGVAATIVNDEVTQKIEESLEDIDWISSISSTSSEGRSSIRVRIEDWFDTDNVVDEIETAVDGVNLPSSIDDDFPIVSQIDITSSDMFSVLLYGDDEDFSFEDLLDIAAQLQSATQWNNGVEDVIIDTNTTYDIRLIFPKEKLDILWINLDSISTAINNNNIDSPIWSYELDGINYTYKLSGKIKTIEELLSVKMYIWDSSTTLWDLWEVELYYGEERINKFGQNGAVWFNYISLTYSKLSGANIFEVSDNAKTAVENELKKDIYSGLISVYLDDEAQRVTQDFSDLSISAIQTLILVFLALIFFVWVRESTIATIILPLAFLLWFIVVEYLWITFNRISTFAFVLAFGIAIDTIIIIVEWASEKVRQWYNPRTAVLIAIKDYKSPIIIWTLTTVAAFIPVLTLPGILGLFLSIIPLVVFIILIATLFVSLTVAGPIFMLLAKSKKSYEVFEERELVMGVKEKELLAFERQWKQLQDSSHLTSRDKIFKKYSLWYKNILKKILSTRKLRVITTLIPLMLLLVSGIFLGGKLWFELFPQWSRDQISINLTGPSDFTPAWLGEQISFVEDLFSNAPEVENFTLSISGNRISSSIYLIPGIERKQWWLRENEILQKELSDTINETYGALWFRSWSSNFRRWPGSSDPVWINLVASNADLFEDIVALTSDFEKFLTSLPEVTEAKSSAADPVASIDFKVNEQQASILWLSERDIFNSISTTIRGRNSISIKWVSDDNKVKLYIDEFMNEVTPSKIENINLNIWGENIRAGSVLEYTITKTSPSITKEDGDIRVWVTASLIDRGTTSQVQAQLEEFASAYNFPSWISYKPAGENVQNAELISTVIQGIFLAFFFIFAILVYQFNSYGQPVVILYSVFMSLSGVIFWLYVTGNPLSMPVWIWFISLLGIVVNDAIVMVDKINKNILQGMKLTTAIVEWAVSRLNPILVTTITTVAGILPIALQDVFWAWLWYTVVFGLATGSMLTLFAVPTLYYIMSPKRLK
jgi:multidrug efflux pump subunit AcrB